MAYITTEDGSRHDMICNPFGGMGSGWVVRPFPEILDAYAERFGSPVVSIAADSPDNVTWRRT